MPSTATPATTPADFIGSMRKHVEPYTAPYYLAIVGVLGAITVVFTVLIGIIILIATNFNVLGLIE